MNQDHSPHPPQGEKECQSRQLPSPHVGEACVSADRKFAVERALGGEGLKSVSLNLISETGRAPLVLETIVRAKLCMIGSLVVNSEETRI